MHSEGHRSQAAVTASTVDPNFDRGLFSSTSEDIIEPSASINYTEVPMDFSAATNKLMHTQFVREFEGALQKPLTRITLLLRYRRS